MPYLFNCPHCQSRTVVDDQYSGLRGLCISCGKPIEIPVFAVSSSPHPPSSSSNLQTSRVIRWIAGGTISAVLVVAMGILVLRYGSQSLQQFQLNRQRGICIQNLEKIAQGLNAYAADYGTYPPPYTTDSRGTPLLSWRVLILPYIGYPNLYSEIDLEQPWSSEKNLALTEKMPSLFASPIHAGATSPISSYHLVTGPGTFFPTDRPPRGPVDASDDPRKTILCAESANLSQMSNSWLAPSEELSISQLNFPIGTSGLGGSHEGGATVVTVDGKAHWIPAGIDPAVLNALATIDGGEAISDDTFQ